MVVVVCVCVCVCVWGGGLRRVSANRHTFGADLNFAPAPIELHESRVPVNERDAAMRDAQLCLNAPPLRLLVRLAKVGDDLQFARVGAQACVVVKTTRPSVPHSNLSPLPRPARAGLLLAVCPNAGHH